MRPIHLLAALAAIALCACASANPRAGADFQVTSVDVGKERLVLFEYDAQHRPYRSFARVAEALARQGKQLRFAMNGGMFEADGSPVGLLVIDGRELAPLNRKSGAGNFYLKPNGVFALTRSGPRVVATDDYPAIASETVHATQSGPMLVKDGIINPLFSPTSTSRYIRNGVCAVGSTVHLVISNVPVTFHEM
ncbi:MAG: phosphodiester glycosidase family protein, partial [Gammaproteobacteria bacterium]